MTLKASFVDLRTYITWLWNCGTVDDKDTNMTETETGATSGRYDGYHDQSGGVNYSLSCMKWVIKD